MKKYLKRISLFATAILVLFALTACDKNDGTTTEGEGATTGDVSVGLDKRNPKLPEDTFVYNLSSMPDTIDPNLNNAVDGSIILNNTMEGLMRLGEDDKPVYGAAESHELSEDGLTYTFKIREDSKWSDGKPVTAENFVYSWKRLLAPETAAEYSALGHYIVGGQAYNEGKGKVEDVQVKAIDEKTLEVKLIAPTAYFLELAAFPTFFPVREDMVEEHGDRWTFSPDTFLTNGMYVFEEINNRENFVLVASDTYWNKDIIKMKKVDIKLIEDEDTSFASYLTGEFDLIDKIPSVNIESATKEGIATIFDQIGTYYVVLNLDEEKASGQSPEAAKALQDPKVRKALSLAINREILTDEIRKGGEVPAHSFVPSSLNDHNGKSFPKEYFDPKGNVEEAKKLLEEAGFPGGEGFPKLTYFYNTGAGHDVVAVAVQDFWKKIGVDCEIKNMEWAALQKERDDKNYLTARHGWISDYSDAIDFLSLFESTSGQNNAGYNNPAYDELLNKSRFEVDQDKRLEYLHQAEDILMEDTAMIPLFYYTDVKGVAPYLKGLRVSKLGAVFFDQVEFAK